MAGQMGMFTRNIYNSKIIDIISDNKENKILSNIKNFGKIKTDCILVRGSIQGPSKRQLIITHSLRPTKKQLKKNFEMIEILR